ncbi:unnamed protein product [Dicrocoelium dendriticum]|nr:unnamed protein product [Dicrocoelium dendriticum]
MRRAITEPDRLLNEYSTHLNDNGGIMLDSVPHLIDLMKSTNGKLVPKCIALCIISASMPEIQLRLCGEGAWDILLKWLQEALKEDNYPFLLELLNVYLSLPVRLEHLTQNVCPKLINSLTKRCEHEAVKSRAMEIVKKWKGVISTDSKQIGINDNKIKCEKEPKPEESLQSADSKHGRKRPRTVKVPPTVMRTAGVEEEAQTQPKSRSEVLAKKGKVDCETKSSPESSIESIHQKITVTPTETRKTPEIHESPDFINALTTTTCSLVRKKRKFLTPKSGTSTTAELQTKESASPVPTEHTDQNSESEASSSSLSPVGTGSKKSSLISLSNSFSLEIKPKKRVSWADEDKLQSFFYFELDESERVNVNRVSLEEIRRKELSMERQVFRRNSDDAIITSQKWHTPLPLERMFLVEPGYKSSERQVQTERERYVLQAIYFTRESIPSTPEEPDPEVVEASAPLDIPLEDLAALDANGALGSQLSSEKLLVMKDSMGNTQMSLNPEIADLVKSLAANLSSVPSVDQPAASANCTEKSHLPDTNNPLVPTATSQSLTNDESQKPNSSSKQTLKHELWEVLEENYPDISVRELSAERIRDLLEPLRDQLIAKGIFHLPHSDSFYPTMPPFQQSPPRPHLNYGPRPIYQNVPPPHLPPPVSLPDFRSVTPMPRPGSLHPGSFRPGPSNFPPLGPPIQYPCGPGPLHNLPPPPHRPTPYTRGGAGRAVRGSQPCKFFQQGTCRNGPACGFLHTKR